MTAREELCGLLDVESLPDAADVEYRALADALRMFFRVDRIPAIIRGRMPALGDRSVLEIVEIDGVAMAAKQLSSVVAELRAWIPPPHPSERI